MKEARSGKYFYIFLAERGTDKVLDFYMPESLVLFLFMAVPAAHGSSRARGGIGAAVAGLRHSHSSVGSKLHLQPTLQLAAVLDP